MRSIKKTGFYSWKIGSLPIGCRLCVKGQKEVIFITGKCSTKCFYCPLSDDKWNKDFIWANEWKSNDIKVIIKEARLCDAKGAGITGGDPFVRVNRTIKAIKMLKMEFGKGFHIHLYAPFNRISAQSLKKLYLAGLDEIRFHPNFHNKSLWSRIKLAKKFKWDVGIEIPAIPCYEKLSIEMIEYMKPYIRFVNINELEVSDTNANSLIKRGYKTKDRVSYAVKGSQELAIKLMRYCLKNTRLNVHYCSSRLKDRVQMAKRLIRRAKNVAKTYDYILSDGSLYKGAIYCRELSPFSRGKPKNEKRLLQKLNAFMGLLIRELDVPKHLLNLDSKKVRIETSVEVVHRLKKFIKEKGQIPVALVEYPTYDRMIVEAELL